MLHSHVTASWPRLQRRRWRWLRNSPPHGSWFGYILPIYGLEPACSGGPLVRSSLSGTGRVCGTIVVGIIAGLLLTGCGSFTRTLRSGSALPPSSVVAPEPSMGAVEPAAVALEPATAALQPAMVADPPPAVEATPLDERLAAPLPSSSIPTTDVPAAPIIVAQATAGSAAQSDTDDEYDPWEAFNEKMFTFNYNLDRYLLKPVARGYRAVLPDQVQIMIDNGFTNITWVSRFVNSLLQGKWEGALREVSRFVLNSTLGFGGLFDPGKTAELQPSQEDFGQTLGLWGVSSGPYLVLPLLGPTTVRDGIGKGVDSAMNPLTYFVPFVGQVGMKVGDTVNDRALNYDLFAGVEESAVDLYSSVRRFYLKRREQMIEE